MRRERPGDGRRCTGGLGRAGAAPWWRGSRGRLHGRPARRGVPGTADGRGFHRPGAGLGRRRLARGAHPRPAGRPGLHLAEPRGAAAAFGRRRRPAARVRTRARRRVGGRRRRTGRPGVGAARGRGARSQPPQGLLARPGRRQRAQFPDVAPAARADGAALALLRAVLRRAPRPRTRPGRAGGDPQCRLPQPRPVRGGARPGGARLGPPPGDAGRGRRRALRAPAARRRRRGPGRRPVRRCGRRALRPGPPDAPVPGRGHLRRRPPPGRHRYRPQPAGAELLRAAPGPARRVRLPHPAALPQPRLQLGQAPRARTRDETGRTEPLGGDEHPAHAPGALPAARPGRLPDPGVRRDTALHRLSGGRRRRRRRRRGAVLSARGARDGVTGPGTAQRQPPGEVGRRGRSRAVPDIPRGIRTDMGGFTPCVLIRPPGSAEKRNAVL
ncbi:putative Biotin carboxylase of acetyl-CoA carboxylase [Streptomyces murinus]